LVHWDIGGLATHGKHSLAVFVGIAALLASSIGIHGLITHAGALGRVLTVAIGVGVAHASAVVVIRRRGGRRSRGWHGLVQEAVRVKGHAESQ